MGRLRGWVQDWEVRELVRRNLQHAPTHLTGDDRIAGRWLFSLLAQMEGIAVEAARRGDGVRGQLRDELSHQQTFAHIAEQLGATEAQRSPEIDELVEYLEGLGGAESLAALNIVAEHWLAGIFERVARWPLASWLFTLIGAEEHRHVAHALKAARPSSTHAQAVVRVLEERLAQVAHAPGFLLPLAHFGGGEEVAQIGLRNVHDHRTACARLGVVPGPAVRDLETMARGYLAGLPEEPELLRLNRWERSRFDIWTTPAPMVSFVDAWGVFPDSPADLEARVVLAVGKALAAHPELRVTMRGRNLYRPKTVRVGVRRMRTRNELVTLHVREPQRLTRGEVEARLERHAARARSRPYHAVRSVPCELRPLVPPTRTPVVVTNCSELGCDFALAPLAELEGTPISVAVGKAHLSGRVTLGITQDHRSGDGRALGLLTREIRERLEAQAA